MKKYIIITYGVGEIGGTQLYTLHKAKYLIQCGWRVYVLHPSEKALDCIKDIAYGCCFLSYPPYLLRKSLAHKCIDEIIKIIDPLPTDEIVIESHTSIFSLWGEMIASRSNAKHVCISLNEIYRGKGKIYEYKLDFFNFKLNRRELSGSKKTLQMLFADYRTISDSDENLFWISEDPVADVYNETVASITQHDYNICYLGRIVKCHPNILDGVRKFADKYPEKKLQMIFVGDLHERKEEIYRVFAGVPNVTILELGDLIPIPRMLYEKLDVVIATAGSALNSAREEVPVLVADADNNLCNGLLWYETNESVRADEHQTTFDAALERVFIERVQDHLEFCPPPERSVAECCEQNFEFIRNSDQEKVYYPEDKLLARPAGVTWKSLLKGEIIVGHPRLTAALRGLKHKLLQRRT